MADSMPIPLPPRTPTPPLDDGPGPSVEQTPIRRDPHALSPHNMDDLDSARTNYFTPSSPEKKDQGPFNFQPAALAKSSIAVKSVCTSIFEILLLD
jgi:hypothetical protein